MLLTVTQPPSCRCSGRNRTKIFAFRGRRRALLRAIEGDFRGAPKSWIESVQGDFFLLFWGPARFAGGVRHFAFEER
jgi:hypothetical protein